MPRASVNGVNLYYEEHGSGAALLGIHGTPSSSLLWTDAAAVLGRHGRCIVYDRRGFHRSDRPAPYETTDLRDHVHDAAALLDRLAATPAVVIGRSTGGLIALALAHLFPEHVRALVLLEPAMFTADRDAAQWAATLRSRVLAAAAVDPGSAAEAVFREALGPDVWPSLPDDLRNVLGAGSPAVLAEIRGHGLDLSAEPLELGVQQLAAIRQPTLLVSAADSPDAMRRINDRLGERLPRAEQVRVEGGHLIDPADPRVLDFIDRVLASDPAAG